MVTPYYRTTSNNKIRFHYKPYDLFCIHTQLQPWLYKKYKSNYYITFESVINDTTQYIRILVHHNNQIVEDEEIQKEIDIIINKRKQLCLLFDSSMPLYDQKGYIISTSWIKSVYTYVTLPIKPIYEDDKIYLDLSDKVNYIDIYNQLSLRLIRRLWKMYDRGYIVNPREDIIRNWDLVKVRDGLYRAKWYDLRWGNMSMLLERINNNEYIEFEFPYYRIDDVKKVIEMSKVSDIIVDEGRVKFKVNSILEAKSLCKSIQLASLGDLEDIVCRDKWICYSSSSHL